MRALHKENCVCKCQMSTVLTDLKPLLYVMDDNTRTRIMTVYSFAASLLHKLKIFEFSGRPLSCTVALHAYREDIVAG